MNKAVKAGHFLSTSSIKMVRFLGDIGSGAGRGGGSGGSIREAGGSLGKFGAANEESYFHKKQREQLENIKNNLQGNQPKPAATEEKKECVKNVTIKE